MRENLESAKQTSYQFSKPTIGRSCDYALSRIKVIVGIVKLTDCGLKMSR